jgi:hypothetical protein
LLDELLVIPGFREATLHLYPPRHAVLDPSRLDAVRALLTERGYAPRVVD